MKQIAVEDSKTRLSLYTYSWVATILMSSVLLAICAFCYWQGIIFTSIVGIISYAGCLYLTHRCFMRLWTDALSREIGTTKWRLENTVSGVKWRLILTTLFFDGVLAVLMLFAGVRTGFNMSILLIALLGGKVIGLTLRSRLSTESQAKWGSLATWTSLFLMIGVSMALEFQLNPYFVLCAVVAKGLFGETATSDRYFWAGQKKTLTME